MAPACPIWVDDPGVTSLTSDDDPPWEQASKGNDSQSWFDAADGEKDNLERFGVFPVVLLVITLNSDTSSG